MIPYKKKKCVLVRILVMVLLIFKGEVMGFSKKTSHILPNEVGLYGNYSDRYFWSENIFDWFMLQVVSNSSTLTDPVKLNESLKKIKQRGKKTIVRIYFWDKYDEVPKPLSEYYKFIDNILNRIDIKNVDIVCLAEENNPFIPGHQEILEKLYTYVKEKYKVLVYQFLTVLPPGFEKADGYFVDFYRAEKEDFSKRVMPFLKTKKPVVCFIEAATDRGWNRKILKIMFDQCEECKKNGISVGWYCVDNKRYIIDKKTGKKISNPFRWGWASRDPLMKLIWKTVIEKTKEIKGEEYDASLYTILARETERIEKYRQERAKKVKKPKKGKLIYKESFDNIEKKMIGKEEGKRGIWEVVNGCLYQRNTSNGYKYFVFPFLLKDFYLKVDIKYPFITSHIGIAFAYQNPNNTYRVIIRPLPGYQDLSVDRIKKGKWLIPEDFVPIPFKIEKGKWYSIEIIRKGKGIYVSINNTILYFNPNLIETPSGKIALINYNGVTCYDNLEIYEVLK